jgi:hypothetical protein
MPGVCFHAGVERGQCRRQDEDKLANRASRTFTQDCQSMSPAIVRRGRRALRRAI